MSYDFSSYKTTGASYYEYIKKQGVQDDIELKSIDSKEKRVERRLQKARADY